MATTRTYVPNERLPQLDKGILSQEQFDEFLDVFNRRHINPVHSDEQYARRRGFKDTLAPGVMAVGYLNELLVKTAGPGFLENGTLTVNFIGPMYPGDRILAQAVVREISDQAGTRRAILDVWCETDEGRKVVAGTATVSLPA